MSGDTTGGPITDQPTVTLHGGALMPQLGFGVFKVPPDQAAATVTMALDAGYRSIDTATMYNNEQGVGVAVKASGLPREQVFITSKLNNNDHPYDKALEAGRASADRLGVDYIDLYLIHWPLPDEDNYVDAWRALIKLREDGLLRSIGVSNFQPPHIQRLIEQTGVIPALNQIELHPYLSQPQLRAFHAEHGIATEAWAPIARGGELLSDPVITSIAAKHDRTAAQVVIRWHLQLGNVVIPKSVTPSRIAENIDVFGFELDDQDMTAINGLERDGRTGPHPDTTHFHPPA